MKRVMKTARGSSTRGGRPVTAITPSSSGRRCADRRSAVSRRVGASAAAAAARGVDDDRMARVAERPRAALLEPRPALARGGARRLGEQHLATASGLRQARGQVDGGAEEVAVPLDGRASVDADPHRRQPVEPVRELETEPNRIACIVGAHHRAVAERFHDRRAVARGKRAHLPVEARGDVGRLLVSPVDRKRGEADEVGEQERVHERLQAFRILTGIVIPTGTRLKPPCWRPLCCPACPSRPSRCMSCEALRRRWRPCAACRSASSAARWSACSARTAPARRRRSRSSRAIATAAAARYPCSATTRRTRAWSSAAASASCSRAPASTRA